MATVQFIDNPGGFWDSVIQATPLAGEYYTVKKFEDVKIEGLIIRETYEINEKYIYLMYRYFLDLVTPDFDESSYWLASTKLYPYFLYSLIISLQNQCRIIQRDLTSNELLEKLKNTNIHQKEAYNDLVKQNEECYKRFLVYESILKSIFNIDPFEKNINTIAINFKSSLDMSDDQIDSIRRFIVNPIFYGFYEKIFKGPFKTIECNENQENCISGIIDIFPYPQMPEQPGFPRKFLPDCLVPILIFNQVARKKGLSIDFLKGSVGIFDWFLTKMTGVNAYHGIGVGETVDKMKNTAAGVVNEIKQQVRNIYNYGAGAYNSASQIGELATPILVLGGLALGLSLVNRVLGD